MTLLRDLAWNAIEHHPERATALLERLDRNETVRLLARGRLEAAAAIVARLSPEYATAVLRGVPVERAGKLAGLLPIERAARALRRVEPELQQAVLDAVDDRRARGIRALLRFPEGSAGALMDPDVLALPGDLSAREALQRVRKAPELARYNVYVVDQAQRLVGALNLRELLLARGRQPLSDLMTSDPHRVLASADRATVIAHPGWQDVHALPVVDADGAFVGVIRYRVLRQLEQELLAPRGEDVSTGAAFGQVIAVGARGLLDAFAGTNELAPRRNAGGHDGNR